MGWALFDSQLRVPLEWDGHHLTGSDPQLGARVITTTVILADGSALELSFDWSDE
jgi:hypothetical protein